MLIDYHENKKNNNKILLCLAVFALTIFVYRDFNIPMMVGYALIAIVVIFSLLTEKVKLKYDNITLAYILLLLFQIIEIGRAIMLGNSEQSLYIPASIMFIICALTISTSEKDIIRIIKVWVVLSVVFSVYIIAVKIAPGIYFSVISRFLSEPSREMNENLLAGGYGIAIGGNIIIMEYIIAFAVIFVLNSILLNRKKHALGKIALWMGVLLFVVAMVFENRKSELLSIIVVFAFLILTKINYTTKARYKKSWGIFIAFSIVVIIGAYLMYKGGNLGRYGVFIDNIMSGNVDISSGRLTLWKIAWGLFLDNPAFGIGWGSFSDHVPEIMKFYSDDAINNVHNCYLQILCETGAIGFVIFTSSIFYVFFKLIKKGKRVNWSSRPKLHRVAFSSCIGYQLFFLVVGAIDPAFYSLMFWCFYTIAVMMARELLRLPNNSVSGKVKEER